MTLFLHPYGVEGPLGFPLLERQARQLDILLRSLPRTKEYEYRHRVVARAPTELNPGERSDVSWITTDSIDRFGEVVLSRGMNNSQFQSNPLVTLGHAYHLPPVGRSLWQKRVKDGDLAGIKAKTKYPERPDSWPAEDSWPPDKVFSLVQAGMLQGKSIGFLPTKVHFADSKEAKKEGWSEGTLVFDEWLLLEYACCFLPANQEALVEQVSKGAFALSPEFLAALGIDPALVVGTDPAKDFAPADQQRVIPFTTLSEVNRAVERAVQSVDLEAIARKSVQDAVDRRRGRV